MPPPRPLGSVRPEAGGATLRRLRRLHGVVVQPPLPVLLVLVLAVLTAMAVPGGDGDGPRRAARWSSCSTRPLGIPPLPPATEAGAAEEGAEGSRRPHHCLRGWSMR